MIWNIFIQGVPWWKQQNEMAMQNGERRQEPPKPSPRRAVSPRANIEHGHRRSPEPFQQLQVVHDQSTFHPSRSDQVSTTTIF